MCGYSSERWAKKGIFVLQAFVDDSGSATGEKRLFLAGYILSVETWKSFSDEWAEALQEPRALKCLHMTQSFYDWTKGERNRKIERLAAVIKKYRPLSIECSISTRDFKEILAPHSPYDLRHPYFACFHALVIQSAKLVEHFGLEGPLDFVFDVQGNVGPDAAIWYEVIKQLQGPSVRKILGGPPIFRNDEEVLPLQAADMLVWHRRLIREPTCPEQQRDVAGSLVFTHAVVDVPREILQSWADAFGKVPGIEAVKYRKGSVKKVVAGMVRNLPPHRLIPAMEALERRARRLRRLKAVMGLLGLSRLWKKFAKKKSIVIR